MAEVQDYPLNPVNLDISKRSESIGWLKELSRDRMREAKGWDKNRRILGLRSQVGSNRITTYRVYRALKQLREFVEFDSEKRGGVPVLRGTRFRLSQLFAQFADGDSVNDLVENLDLDGEMLKNLMHSISVVIDQPAPHERDPA